LPVWRSAPTAPDASTSSSTAAGAPSWYGSWWVGTTRVKRKIGLKRTAGNADGLTRTQAERELRRRVEATVVVAQGQRRTIGEAGDAYISHLENVMERKRTTIADYRGYLRRHLAPFFGDRPMDRIDPAKVEAYLHAKRGDGLSPRTVQNHLNFLHGIFAFAIRVQGPRALRPAGAAPPRRPRAGPGGGGVVRADAHRRRAPARVGRIARWAIVPTWLFFVILGNASSGGAVSPPLLPAPFAFISHWLPSGATVTALRDAVYFPADQHVRPLAVQALWAAALFPAWLIVARRRQANAAAA
jgi:hypothetical protein